MRLLERIAGLMIGILLLCSQKIKADEEAVLEKMFTMDLADLLEMKVAIASFNKQAVIDSPGTVYVISRQDIERYGWRDLKEILAAIPNLDYFNHWNWLPGGQRGFTGNFSGTLLMIDGRDVQNILANEAFIKNDFPSHKIERVEILQGANSTLYGGNAAQGVINVITRLESEHQQLNEAQLILGEVGLKQLAYNYKTTKDSYTLAFSGSAFSSDQNYDELAEFVVDTERFSRDPGRDALRNLDPAHFENNERNWTMNLRWLSDDWYAGLNYQMHINDKGLEKARIDFGGGDQSKRGFRQFFAGKNFAFDNGIQGFIELIHFTEIKEKWAQKNNNREATSYQELDLAIEYSEITPSKRYTLKTRWNKTLQDGAILTWGYDGWQQKMGDSIVLKDRDGDGIFAFERTVGWAIDKADSEVNAIYGQYATNWQFENQRSLSLTAGLRYHTQSYTNNDLLPRVGLVFKADENQAWKLTYGKAFRPPTSLEFEGTVDSEIESQEMTMWELGHNATWKTESGSINNSFAVYDMQAKNFYQRKFFPEPSGDGGVWRTLVSGEHSVWGFENLLKWQANDWQGSIGYRWVKPDEQEYQDQSFIADIPQSKIKIGLQYLGFEKVSLAAFVDHWGEVKSLSNSSIAGEKTVEKLDSWTTLNLHLSFALTKLKGVPINAAFYVENLFDQTYYHANARGSSPYQFLQAPRNIRFQLNATF